jgi:hypothetical protein
MTLTFRGLFQLIFLLAYMQTPILETDFLKQNNFLVDMAAGQLIASTSMQKLGAGDRKRSPLARMEATLVAFRNPCSLSSKMWPIHLGRSDLCGGRQYRLAPKDPVMRGWQRTGTWVERQWSVLWGLQKQGRQRQVTRASGSEG